MADIQQGQSFSGVPLSPVCGSCKAPISLFVATGNARVRPTGNHDFALCISFQSIRHEHVDIAYHFALLDLPRIQQRVLGNRQRHGPSDEDESQFYPLISVPGAGSTDQEAHYLHQDANFLKDSYQHESVDLTTSLLTLHCILFFQGQRLGSRQFQQVGRLHPFMVCLSFRYQHQI